MFRRRLALRLPFRTTGAVLTTLLILGFAAGPAASATLHYWRFESVPGFTSDSVGGLTLSASTGSPTSIVLPPTGRGSAFPVAVPSTTRAAEFTGSDVFAAPAFALSDFTAEAIVHVDGVSGSFGSVIAGMADSQLNNAIGWILQIRSGQLTLALCNGGSCELVFSGLAMLLGQDYFVAASVDLDGLSTTFYLQDLTAGGVLQSATVAHSSTTLNAPTSFAIGGAANGNLPFDGLIDEVRISDHARGAGELLVAAPEPPLVPSMGPGSLLVLSLALAGLAGALRTGPGGTGLSGSGS